METTTTPLEELRFELIERLGKGGAGSVWRARLWGHHGITRMVAIKVVEAGDEGVLRRVRDEARLLSLLNHRALVTVQDLVALEGGRWGLVMELLEGVDLQGLSAMGPVPWGVVLDVVAEVADALDCALKTRDLEGRPLGLTHRDIKPGNLVMCVDGRIKLLDFGVARANLSTREAVTLQGELWGTLGYMSPERLRGEDSPAVDVYALGVVLYEMGLRQRFGRAQLNVHDYEDQMEAAQQRLRAARAPEGLVALFLSMMDFQAHARPSAGAVRDRARALRATLPEPALAPWAERVVPYGRQARLTRMAAGTASTTLHLRTVSAVPQLTPPTMPAVPAIPGTRPSPPRRPARWMDTPLRSLPAAMGLMVAVFGLFSLALILPSGAPAREVASPSPGVPAIVETAAPSAPVLAAPTVVSPPVAPSAPESAPRAAPRHARPPADVAPTPAAPALVSAPVAPPATEVVITRPATPEQLGLVRLSGMAAEVVARAGGEEWPLPGALPEGTYTLFARYDDAPLAAAGTVRVAADQVIRVRCDEVSRHCMGEP